MSFKLGIVGLDNQSGLGRLMEDFNNHYDCYLLVPNHPKGQYKRYENAHYCNNITPTDQEIIDFLTKIDLLLSFETPYSANLFRLAKAMGKPVVCMTMYECMRDSHPMWNDVDVFISCSLPDMREVTFKNKVYLPVPIDTDRIPFIQRKGKIRKIIHNAGYSGYRGRNGTTEVAKFMNRYKGDIELILRAQVEPDTPALREDPRILIDMEEKPFEELYAYGDLFFFPCRFNGLCLPVQEALASGLPVLTSELLAWDGLLPVEWQIPMQGKEKIAYGRMIETGYIDVKEAIKRFEWFLAQDLAKMSKLARILAEKRSWRVLKPRYDKLFNTLLK